MGKDVDTIVAKPVAALQSLFVCFSTRKHLLPSQVGGTLCLSPHSFAPPLCFSGLAARLTSYRGFSMGVYFRFPYYAKTYFFRRCLAKIDPFLVTFICSVGFPFFFFRYPLAGSFFWITSARLFPLDPFPPPRSTPWSLWMRLFLARQRGFPFSSWLSLSLVNIFGSIGYGWPVVHPCSATVVAPFLCPELSLVLPLFFFFGSCEIFSCARVIRTERCFPPF